MNLLSNSNKIHVCTFVLRLRGSVIVVSAWCRISPHQWRLQKWITWLIDSGSTLRVQWERYMYEGLDYDPAFLYSLIFLCHFLFFYILFSHFSLFFIFSASTSLFSTFYCFGSILLFFIIIFAHYSLLCKPSSTPSYMSFTNTLG